MFFTTAALLVFICFQTRVKIYYLKEKIPKEDLLRNKVDSESGKMSLSI